MSNAKLYSVSLVRCGPVTVKDGVLGGIRDVHVVWCIMEWGGSVVRCVALCREEKPSGGKKKKKGKRRHWRNKRKQVYSTKNLFILLVVKKRLSNYMYQPPKTKQEIGPIKWKACLTVTNTQLTKARTAKIPLKK